MRLEYSDVPDNMKNIYEIVGKHKFIEIVSLYGGQMVYFPTSKSIHKISRNKDIIKRYNGINVMELAREYRITTNQIRRIVKEGE